MKRKLNYFSIDGAVGGNQEWFRNVVMYMGGCAAATACDSCIYLAKYKGLEQLYPGNVEEMTKEDYISFSMKMKPYLRPRIQGVKKLSMFLEGFDRYLEDCKVEKVSDFIRTEPYGVTDQDEFLNGALKMETLLTPHELLELLHRIEQEAGRKRIRRWGPRTLDLDIIFYGDQIIEEDDLCIPHIDMQNREFVLGPMCEIAPHKRHPVLKETMTEMLVKLKGNN